MTTYTVSYDLNNQKDYPRLWAELERLGGQRTQNSYWLVSVGNTAKELHDHLKSFMDGDDALWVTELTRNHYYSKAKAGTNNWIESHPPAR
ncbi:CRISPR-associated endonuclease Cas2 [Luteimonas fraxinea]|uniref:CRISPR-associated endoribonuclease Cas2 n=1 Tax=Luteimonas fraxinea TaxID=2901869 RepID=A0ABS8UGM3_9GAMM|nr:CRISPR-associated endonuclease Cas2 [Luteimonas fraxinea]MCD9098045.1 CRISPR-associated endonuclease Cas2 [Luteimonas fraxinea]UHH09230.1 CRISPR-associated endonuclease Cas2 [Luteimonas fraxinea]